MSLARQEMYERTGSGYERGTYGAAHMRSYGKVRNNTLARIVSDTFGAGVLLRVLEVGCGTGLSLEYLSRLPARHSLYGVDFSRTMLAQAAEKAASLDNPPKLLLGSGFHLPFPSDTFDVVFATRFIHQFPHPDKKRVYREFLRVLRHQGIVVVEFYARFYHWFRYFVSEHKKKSKDSFFSHYPTTKEVREIVATPYRTVALRIAGARPIRRVFGEGVLERMIRVAGRRPFRVLADEYFVVARK